MFLFLQQYKKTQAFTWVFFIPTPNKLLEIINYQILKKINRESRCVIALGGGANKQQYAIVL